MQIMERLEFFGNCNVGGLGATVTCSDASGMSDELGTASWHALDPDTDQGEIDRLNEGFFCEMVVPGICTVRVDAQELPIPGGRNRADLIDNGEATMWKWT
jgi:hypothetical protein